MHEVLVHCLGSLNLTRKSVVRSTDGPDMNIFVYHGRKIITKQQQNQFNTLNMYVKQIREIQIQLLSTK